MKSLNSNKIVVSVLLFLIFFFSLLLYFDFKRKIGIGDKEIIGIIRYKEKLIQRKIDGQVVWETVDRDTPITNLDSVRTADRSNVTIELNDKTQIDMDQNSMILLDFSNQNINLDFAYGAFTAKRSENENTSESKLNIKSGDKTIELQKSDVKLTKTDDKNLNLTVDKGNATIKTKEGEQVIQKDQLVTVKEEKVEVQANPVKLTNPLDRSIFMTAKDLVAVSFSWEPQSPSQKQVDSVTNLEISEDYQFIKKTKKISVTKENSAELQLPTSTYYWRVVTNNQNKPPVVSEVRKFSLINEEPIKLFSPANKAKYTYTNSLPIVTFSWNKSEYASSYKLEIARDNEFKDIVKSLDSHTNRFGFDGLTDGKYFARVSSKFVSANTAAQVSEIVMFSVEKKVDLDPVEITALDTTTTTVTAVEKEKFVLNWKGSPEYTNYEVQISDDKSFNNILENQKVTKNFHVPSKYLKKNSYYWRVRGITKDGKNSNYSTSKFEIKEPASLEFIFPKDNEEFAVRQSDKIDFKWNKVDLYGNFKLEISNKPDFTSIYKSETTASFGTSLDGFNPGTYYVRLSLVNSETNEELLKSKPRSFKIPLLLNEPILKSPRRSEVVDMSNLDTLNFNWEPVPNAVSYRIELFQKADNGDKLIVSDDVNTNQYVVKELNILDEGKFKWQIKAKVKSTEGKDFFSPIAVEFFTIALKSAPSSAPEIVTPKKQHIDKKF
ncbi:MAG: FecR domain-containing protein [Leptospiraceae bacterium]|nr:FecR domain-containing protein [Leptospiraceae bacterium]